MPGYDTFIRDHTRLQSVPLVPGLRVYQCPAVFPLWQAVEALTGAVPGEPPWWAIPWAGGVALAWYLEGHPELCRDAVVLDFACGGGLAGLVAARHGARRVILGEIDPIARVACRLNAEANGLEVHISEADLLAGPPVVADLVLAGDIFYNGNIAARVRPWLAAHVAAGSTVLIGDPGRKYLPVAGMELLGEVEVPASLDWEDRVSMIGRVHRFRG